MQKKGWNATREQSGGEEIWLTNEGTSKEERKSITRRSFSIVDFSAYSNCLLINIFKIIFYNSHWCIFNKKKGKLLLLRVIYDKKRLRIGIVSPLYRFLSATAVLLQQFFKNSTLNYILTQFSFMFRFVYRQYSHDALIESFHSIVALSIIHEPALLLSRNHKTNKLLNWALTIMFAIFPLKTQKASKKKKIAKTIYLSFLYIALIVSVCLLQWHPLHSGCSD